MTITGTNFTGATAVKFGVTAATSFTVNSATQITATSPAGSAGAVDITVTTPGGTSATGAADQFTYVTPAPTVTGVAPNSGTTAGGTSVTITGTNFTGATAVKFGVTAATSFTVNSATQITATSPAGSAGAVDITVTTPGGTSATGAADQFTYVTPAPTVTGVAPNSGTTAGGTSVTITGTNFTGATAVKFGVTAATSFTVNSATQITATSPAGSAGAVDITVTTPGGTSATGAADQFTYVTPAPTVTGVAPNSGTTAGGTSVTITGTNFTGATAVKFGVTAATSFTVNSATQITATSPAGSAGAVDITVTTPGGTSATGAADQFTYVTPAPTVSGVAPNSGTTAGGTSVTITGTNFTGATAVTIGGNAATSVTVVSATIITVITPAHAAGAADVAVTTAGGTSSMSNAFTFVTLTQPTITSISPNRGPSTGGTSVTISGTNFSGATAVMFGGTAATSYFVASTTTITATTPKHSLGAADVTVVTPGGTATAASAFSYEVPDDSVHLRSLQIALTKMVAQTSGQVTSAAIDDAIADGFSDNDQPIIQTGNGLRFNFAAEPRQRIDDAFQAMAMATKAPKAAMLPPPKVWLPWLEVAGTNWKTNVQTGDIRGDQFNALAGLTHKFSPNLLFGAFGGYENFDYNSQSLSGRLKGDGWTLGSYFGWRLMESMRLDLGLAYSRVNYDGTAGTAAGSFPGTRWFGSLGLTGTYKLDAFTIEPSARIYTLFEHEDAYIDSLGTPQADRNFSSGRASTGIKLGYQWTSFDSLKFSPYVGIYGDYYFTSDDGVAPTGTPQTLVSGWSARISSGLAVKNTNGVSLSFGTELGGLGSSQFITLSGRGRVSIPF